MLLFPPLIIINIKPHIKEGLPTNYERITREHTQLQEQIKELQTQISALPDGKLVCCHNKNRYKWFQSNGHEKTYIPKSNQFLAEQLALKKYLSLKLAELTHKIRALNFYLDHYPKNTERAEHLLTEPSGFSQLLSTFFTPLSQELSSWASSEYEHSLSYTEQLIHKTASGNLVRSKSEAMIDMFLYTNKVPFRYECALDLGEITLFPDFTIRHPKTGEFYYWEHFGRMDDPHYYKNTYSKLLLYNAHGIVPSINLITTYETLEKPLNSEVIEKIIEHYFL